MDDLGGFDDVDFSVAAWVNAAIERAASTSTSTSASNKGSRSSSSNNSSSTDGHITSLVTRLQLLAQETNDGIETCMSRVLVAMPAASSQLGAVGQQVGVLRSDLDGILRAATAVEAAQALGEEEAITSPVALASPTTPGSRASAGNSPRNDTKASRLKVLES